MASQASTMAYTWQKPSIQLININTAKSQMGIWASQAADVSSTLKPRKASSRSLFTHASPAEFGGIRHKKKHQKILGVDSVADIA